MYSFKEIEEKWQKKWEEKQVFKAKESKKKKFMILEMFPYPSSYGLHVGHARNYVIGDVFSRFKRMQGFNVLYPMGYDSFGLPAENAAIKEGTHPKEYTEKSIKNFIRQQKLLGLSYDWTRLVASHTKEYYKWDQWIFLQFLKKGLAYRKKAAVNFCKKCNTVLANEQVVNGKCWRHSDVDVEIKYLEQWFFKITNYCDDLLKGLDKIDWPENIKDMQKNWIGKSHGTEIIFEIPEIGKWPIFTTRPDTIYGVTFMVISAQHPRLMELVTEKQKKEVEMFLKKVKSTSEKDIIDLEKEGAFTGSYAINPMNNEKVPIYCGNFVVAEYGSGMVMAVPAHDQRDYEFAKKYKINIKQVIEVPLENKAYTGEGNLINSDKFNGINSKEAIQKITEYLEKNKLGKKSIQYKLRDWLISRQRYWGCPIPIVYCDKCGIVPVPENKLPVELPDNVNFKSGGNPLTTNKEFVNVKCPKCKSDARRETDTMDTFVDSSWYFFRYCDNKNSKEIFDKKKVNYWMPINQYIGGREHSTGHLIYCRFFTKVFKEMKLIDFDEPALKLFNQGDVNKDGLRMSKSKGNVVDPVEIIEKYGTDTLRTFLLFVSSPDSVLEWNDKEIIGIHRFLNSIYELINFNSFKDNKKDKIILSKLNRTIKDVTVNIENFEFNKALIKIMGLVNYLESVKDNISKKTFLEVYEKIILMLSIFSPHMCEELWNKLGNKSFICLEKWPNCNEKFINEKLEILENNFENLIRDIKSIIKMIGIEQKEILLIVGYSGMYKKEKINQEDEFNYLKGSKEILEKEFNCIINILRAEESKEEKAKKAKPLKPAIVIK
ncbi:MAG: leucine--tRNA ligase [archaeon]